MQYGVWHVERRDSATRDDFAKASLAFCRAVRGLRGVEECRYYWKPFDTIVIMAEADSAEAWNTDSVILAKASFDLFDVGRLQHYEEWIDARSGEKLHASARGDAPRSP